MHCRLCGVETPLDPQNVCPDCREQLRSGDALGVRLFYCVRCGAGRWQAEVFDKGGVCWQCRGRMRTEPLRRAVPCRACEGGSFVRVRTVTERSVVDGTDGEAPSPIGLALMKRRTTSGTDYVPIGTLEAYVCRGCGLTELYTKEHETLPIGPEWGTELFEVPQTPYR